MHLLRDYESRSTLNLPKVGAQRYARHPETDVHCCAFAVDDGPVELWVPGDPVPQAWVAAARDPEWIVSAFNDQFERCIETHIAAIRLAACSDRATSLRTSVRTLTCLAGRSGKSRACAKPQ
jgi:DNA polymerase bacteriophage-type